MNTLLKALISTFTVFTIAGSLSLYGADTINLNSDSGVWNNAASGGGTPSNFSGGGTNQIHWGFPAGGPSNSGYLFTPNAPQTNLSLDTPFALGTFTHFNFPITGNALTSVDLSVSGMLNINGSSQAFAGVYHFLHNETPNIPTAGNPNCCNDIVSFQNNTSTFLPVTINGVAYVIGLIGFSTSPGGPLLSQFSTIENQQNVATLFAEISKPEVFLPEPSTYAVLGGMLLLGVYLRSKHKMKAKA